MNAARRRISATGRTTHALAVAFGFATVLGCTREAPRGAAPRPSVAAVGGPETAAPRTTAPDEAPPPHPPPSPPALAPLEGPWLDHLAVDQGEAWVAVPVGAREPRPVIVGVHGAGDHPDWSCSEWFASAASYAFVVCPKGFPSQWKGSFAWGSAEQIASRADEALRVLRARFGAHVAPGPVLYGGWSQGATLASNVIASRPGAYAGVVLVEVGHTPLDANAVARNLEKGGVSRVVVSCSSHPCRGFAARLARPAERRHLDLRVNDVGIRGHWFDEPVFRSLGPNLTWITDDDPRWSGLGDAVAARWDASPKGGG